MHLWLHSKLCLITSLLTKESIVPDHRNSLQIADHMGTNMTTVNQSNLHTTPYARARMHTNTTISTLRIFSPTLSTMKRRGPWNIKKGTLKKLFYLVNTEMVWILLITRPHDARIDFNYSVWEDILLVFPTLKRMQSLGRKTNWSFWRKIPLSVLCS